MSGGSLIPKVVSKNFVSWTVVPHSINCEFPYLLLHVVDSSLFTRQPISKPVLTGPSPLAKLLAEQEKKVSNPFFQYSKFNGEVSWRWLSRSIGSGDIALFVALQNHGASSASKYVIFLAMAKVSAFLTLVAGILIIPPFPISCQGPFDASQGFNTA